MGNQCSASSREQFQLVQQIDHQSLGRIKLLRALHQTQLKKRKQENNQQINDFKEGDIFAIFQLFFSNIGERDKHLKYVKQSSEYHRIPTLIKILGFETSDSKNQQNNFNSFGKNQCSKFYSTRVYFQYYPKTLRSILLQRKSMILSKKINCKQISDKVKLNNYSGIDKLPDCERKILNLYFQQIDILKFIDYIIGALYFLNHIEHRNQAVCPQNILVDQKGNYALVDTTVFNISTNYQIAFQQINKHQIINTKQKSAELRNRDGLSYLAPQLLIHIKNRDLFHSQSSQKIQIFSVGLVALQMCLVQFSLFQEEINQKDLPVLIDKNNCKFLKPALTKALLMAQKRYSFQLVDLIQQMLDLDPRKRINFGNLIDKLSPLLMKNIENIQSLFSNSANYKKTGLQQKSIIQLSEKGLNSNRLIHKIMQLDNSYQKVISKTNVIGLKCQQNDNFNKFNEQKNLIQDEIRILRQLKKVDLNLKIKNSKLTQNQKQKSAAHRVLKGSELYEIYLNQYQTIKINK